MKYVTWLALVVLPLWALPALAQTGDAPAPYPSVDKLEAGLGSDDPDFLFWVGTTAVQAAAKTESPRPRKQYLTIATRAFQRILVIDPAALRPRLELARTFFLLEEDALAKEHFEKVLAATLPPSVQRNIQYYLNLMQRRKRWFFTAGAALAPDTNIGASSEEDTLLVGGIPFQLNTPDHPESGTGLHIWGNGRYFHPLRPNLNWRVGADLSIREYARQRFDQMHASVQTGPQWLLGALDLSVLAKVGHTRRGNRPESDEQGFRVESWRRLTPRLSLNLHGHRGRRTYRENQDQNGPRWRVGAQVNFHVTPQLTAWGGLRYDRASPMQVNYRSRQRSLDLGGNYDLSGGLSVGLNASVSRTVFEPHWGFLTLGTPERKDRQRSYRLSLHHRGWTLKGFAPRVSVIRDALESNAQLQSYQRWHGEIALIKQF